MKQIKSQKYSIERSLYNIENTRIFDCCFGDGDGESPLKECTNIEIIGCKFDLRYPMWHVNHLLLENSNITILSRAALWYGNDICIENTLIDGIKAIRECSKVVISNSNIKSDEFCWFSNNVSISKSSISGLYGFFQSKKVYLENVTFEGKYSFQYNSDLIIKNSKIDTKDAFWHSKNVIVSDSEITGEYLGWFSENLTLINCKIRGTQPLCYCKKLHIINCDLTGCDLAFEYSDLDADIIGNIESIKNPTKGKILYENCNQIILNDSKYNCDCIIIKK